MCTLAVSAPLGSDDQNHCNDQNCHREWKYFVLIMQFTLAIFAYQTRPDQTGPNHINKRPTFYLDYCAGYPHDHMSLNSILRGVKKRIFYSQADCKRLPPPPLRSAFCQEFWECFFILDCDSMYSEMDFTPEKLFSSN